MVGGIIIWSFLLAGIITGLGIAFFMWLNAKDSTMDDRSYEQDFDPGRMVSKYKRAVMNDEDRFNADEQLGAYAHREGGRSRSAAEAEEESVVEAEEVLEAEIVYEDNPVHQGGKTTTPTG